METEISKKKSNRIVKILGKYVGEKAFFAYVVCFMIFIPMGEFVSELLGENFITQPIIHTFMGYVGLGMAILWFLLNLPKKNIKPSDIFFLTLLFFLIISYVFSKEREVSANRNFYEETMPNFFAYYSLMFAATHVEDAKYRKRVLGVFIALTLFESIICVFQSAGIRVLDSCFDPQMHASENLSYGLAQHQNFYGALSVLFFGASSGIFVFKVCKKWVVPSGIVAALALYGSLSTSGRLTWLGNGTILIFMIISILIMKKKTLDKETGKKYLIRFGALVAITVVVVGIILVTSDKIQGELKQTNLEMNAEQGEADNPLDPKTNITAGNGRVYLWSFAFEALPDNWLTGVGPDNFRWCFYNSPRWHHPMWYNDKAHNEYIHTMITLGVPALLNYLFMLVFAIVTAIRNIIALKNKDQDIVTWVFLGMMCGYMVQAMVNSSVINIAMYFWVTVGMVMPRFSQRWKKLKVKDESGK